MHVYGIKRCGMFVVYIISSVAVRGVSTGICKERGREGGGGEREIKREKERERGGREGERGRERERETVSKGGAQSIAIEGSERARRRGGVVGRWDRIERGREWQR